MRQYLEMQETLTMDEQTSGILGTYIRVEVDNKPDAVSKKNQFTSQFVGKPHTAKHHICNHPNNGCTEEDV